VFLFGALISGLACNSDFWDNTTAPLTDGSSSTGAYYVYFVNETDYRVFTYWGAYNPLDLDVNTQFNVLTLEAGEESSATGVYCTRRMVLAGEDLKSIVEQTDPEGLSPDDINSEIYFSNEEDPDADDALEPSAGTAESVTFFIGVNYNCGDSVEVHFKQDPTTSKFYTEMAPYEEDSED
jgi:hypothetical protein